LVRRGKVALVGMQDYFTTRVSQYAMVLHLEDIQRLLNKQYFLCN